ncbi:MAG: VPLPA-CTERM sorting domain-containing protein [Pseudomonadota bacterium]
MKRLFALVTSLFFGSIMGAHAAPMTLGGVNFDTDDAASEVLWAQGGVFAGLPQNRREACIDPTDRNSTVGATGEECRAVEAAGFDLDESVELDENNVVLQDPDVLAVFFDEPLINGAGDDMIVFETLNQDDSPALTMMLNGEQLTGTNLAVVEVDGKTFTIWGFDFSDLPLNLAMGATIGEPIFLQTFRDDENTPIGSSDIAAIVGLNFGEIPEIPLPAAFPLFLAGLAGFGLTRRRKR